MSLLLRRLIAAIRRRPRTTIAAVTLCSVALVGGLGLASVATSGDAPVGAGPTFTYADTWDLLELERAIDAGEVIAITVPSGGTGPADLAAKTASGQVIRVELDVTAAAAADALAGLGHQELLTTEAWAAVRSLTTSGDPLRQLAGIVLPIATLVLLALVLLRISGRRSLTRGGTTPSFTTVLPAAETSPRSAAAGTAAAPGVRLADVAGCDEAKLELTETIEFLRDPARFAALGAHIPHGIMLFGPPGTGKTMLARAVAAEAGVPFMYASGSEFVEKYVGVGARRIRDLFAQARRLGQAVIFFDEFDALGKARGGPNSHEEREQTLNQLLVELDGFGTSEDIVVIAATNRLDILDPAVLRPGRFTRKIHVGLPDVEGRREILAVHAAGKPLATTVDLESIARRTYGFSGAQLADLLNEAAILAARRAALVIEPDDLHAGWLKVAVGTSRRRSMDERERSIIAAHEVGHAICGRVHGDKRRVEEISLFAHGEALGVTVSSQEDNDLPAESDLRARLVALMGGRAAEELLFQEVTGGASNDFEMANQIAVTMVTRFGMGRDPEATDHGTSGRGQLSFLVARTNGSMPDEVQPAATRAIRAILDEAYAEACETLVTHMTTLRRIAAYLVEQERVDGETFEALFEGRLEVLGAGDEWRPVAARPRAWGEIVPFRDRRFVRARAVGEGPIAVATVASGGGAGLLDLTPVESIQAAANGRSALADAPIAGPIRVTAASDPGSAPVRRSGPWAARIRASGAARGLARVGGLRMDRSARRTAATFLRAAELRVRPAEEARP